MENHYLSLENREKLTINQVIDVDAFDENNLWANVKEGAIEICGEKLNVEKLDLNEGILVVRGKIIGFNYLDKKVYEKNRIFKLFKKKAWFYMTILMGKQISIMIIMCACGLCIGLVLDIFKIFVRRFFSNNTIATTFIGIMAAVVVSFLIGEYSFFCQNGKNTFTGAVAFFVGLWLWYKYFYDIISLGEKDE